MEIVRLRRGSYRPPTVTLDADELKAKIGRRIKERRLELELSQDALAAAIGMDRGQLSRVEYGEGGLTTENAVKISHVLNIDIGDLLNA